VFVIHATWTLTTRVRVRQRSDEHCACVSTLVEHRSLSHCICLWCLDLFLAHYLFPGRQPASTEPINVLSARECPRYLRQIISIHSLVPFHLHEGVHDDEQRLEQRIVDSTEIYHNGLKSTIAQYESTGGTHDMLFITAPSAAKPFATVLHHAGNDHRFPVIRPISYCVLREWPTPPTRLFPLVSHCAVASRA
jgi:hypothetical protein